MAEDSTTQPSEPDQTPGGDAGAAGAGGDGGSGGSQGADTFAQEREQLEAQRRSLQSERDRLAAELAKLKGEQPTPKPQEEKPSLSAEGVMALLKKDRELTAAATSLREQFPFADGALFQDYDQFESAEAFKTAVETSHTRIKALAEKAAEPLIAERLKPYVEKFGELKPAAPQSGDGGSATGLPTLAELAAASQAQMDAWAKQHGEDFEDQVLRSAINQ